MGRTRTKIVVRQRAEWFFFNSIILFLGSVWFIFEAVQTDINGLYVFVFFSFMFFLYLLIDFRNRKVIAYEWGLLICDWFGHVQKVKYNHISAIRVESARHKTKVYIEVGETYLISFSSLDDNYPELMTLLTSRVPEAIIWSDGIWS